MCSLLTLSLLRRDGSLSFLFNCSLKVISSAVRILIVEGCFVCFLLMPAVSNKVRWAKVDGLTLTISRPLRKTAGNPSPANLVRLFKSSFFYIRRPNQRTAPTIAIIIAASRTMQTTVRGVLGRILSDTSSSNSRKGEARRVQNFRVGIREQHLKSRSCDTLLYGHR